MKKIVEAKYNLKVNAIIKVTNNTYKLMCEEGAFLLKYHKDQTLESIFARLSMLNNEVFLLPIRSYNGNFLENYENLYFSIYPFLQDEVMLNKDIRLHFYVKAIANLHLWSHYSVKVSDGFFNESLDYLERQCDNAESLIKSRIERIEREEYHSPSDWYFLMNYDHLSKAIDEARRRIDNLEEAWKEESNLNLSLTYQNFDYSHILVKQNKIVSLDKMAIAPEIYDLRQLFNEAYISRIDIATLIKEYMDINPLQSYEKEWLLAFLFIPNITYNRNDMEDISALFKTLSKLHSVESFANILNENINSESDTSQE
ncbi:MAG: hypothetical protein J1F32_04350 [Erysipelotrichales bacterium]|nr:hypothetical protein [Erysipelotrichales bacterium]